MAEGMGLGETLAQRRYRVSPLERPSGTATPMAGSNYSDILPPIQTEIGRSQMQGDESLNNFLDQRSDYRSMLGNDLTDTMNWGLQASTPGIENRLQSLGIAQSGAYPEALAKQRAGLLSSSILPTLTNFDLGTFDTASQMPMNTLNRVQGLQSGSLQRGFGLEDQNRQMGFQQGLADKAIEQQKLASMLGLVSPILQSNMLSGIFGGGGAGGGMGVGMGAGGAAGGGGLGGLFGGLPNIPGIGGMGPILGSAGLGGLGAAAGGGLGLGDWGQALLGGLGGYMGGGGLGGAVGGAIGGGLGGGTGGAIGAGLGGVLNGWAGQQGGWGNVWDNYGLGGWGDYGGGAAEPDPSGWGMNLPEPSPYGSDPNMGWNFGGYGAY